MPKSPRLSRHPRDPLSNHNSQVRTLRNPPKANHICHRQIVLSRGPRTRVDLAHLVAIMLQRSASDRRMALWAGGDCLNNKSKRLGIGSRASPDFKGLITAPAQTPGRPICDIKICPPPPDRAPHRTPHRTPLQTFQASTVTTEVVTASQEPSNLPNHHPNTPNTRPTTNGVANQHTPPRDHSNLPTTKSPHKSRAQTSNPNTTPPRPTGPPPQTPPHSPQLPHRPPAPTRTTSPVTTASTPRTAAAATTRPSLDPRLPRRPPAAARLAPIPHPHHHRRRSPTRPPCRRKTTASLPCPATEQQRQRRLPTSSRSCLPAP